VAIYFLKYYSEANRKRPNSMVSL